MTQALSSRVLTWVKVVFGSQSVVGPGPACDLRISSCWLGGAALSSSTALLFVSIAQAGGRRGLPWGETLLWISFCSIFAVPAFRAISVRAARTERILMICLASIMAFLVKQIYSPTSFAHFDEYLHWITLSSILHTGRNFNENSLLPISPYYPGLELCTSALKQLTGEGEFFCASIIIAISRVLTVLLIFRLVERLTASSRIAAVSTFVFMGNSAFVFFDQQFAYESVAFPLFCACLFLCIFVNARQLSMSQKKLHTVFFITVIIGLTLTHHLTSYIAASYVVAILLCEFFLGKRMNWPQALIIGLAAICAPFLWSRLSGAPTGTYLAPTFALASLDIFKLLSGASHMRGLFAASAGPATPVALKLGSIIGTAFIAIGLATGYFRAIQSGLGSALTFNLIELKQRIWRRPLVCAALVILAASTVLFPVSVALRLTPNGWELGNRLGPFIFVSVSVVLGVAVRRFWQRGPSPIVTGSLTCAVITIIFSGMVSGWGVDALRGHYQIAADALSIERMGVSASKWTAAELGAGNRFASDRVNQILLAGYGKQISLTSLSNQVEISQLFLSEAWGDEARSIISRASLDYILIDLRLTEGRPKFGYFDSAPADPLARLRSQHLLKFNGAAGVSRIYDNGYIIIYDVRAIHGRTR